MSMPTYLSKTIRAAVVLAALVIYAFIMGRPALRQIPLGVSYAGLCGGVVYGISLFIRDEVPLPRRLGTAHLAFAGMTYLVLGVLGLLDGSSFVLMNIWDGFLNPYVVVWLFGDKRVDLQSLPNALNYIMPQGVGFGFSCTVAAFSFIAVIAALSMARSNRFGLVVWIGFLGYSLLLTGCYWYIGIHYWGLDEIRAQLLWEASYLVAFSFAVWNVKWGEAPRD